MYYVKKTGLVKAAGKDVLDLINRLSSNTVGDLKTGSYKKTILLNEKGRIVDLINLFRLENDFFIETSEGKEDGIIGYFDKFTFMEDVNFKKEEGFSKILVFNDDARFPEILSAFNIPSLGENDFAGTGDMIIYKDNFKISSLNIIAGEEKVRDILKSVSVGEMMSRGKYEDLRIKKGLPEKELNEQINPLECGLDEFISYSKGCYIGQEVIARLDAQGKRPKQMVHIVSGGRLEENDKIFTEEGKEAGFVSSVSNNSGAEASNALGFIRSMNLDFSKKYFVQDDGKKVSINISKIN